MRLHTNKPAKSLFIIQIFAVIHSSNIEPYPCLLKAAIWRCSTNHSEMPVYYNISYISTYNYFDPLLPTYHTINPMSRSKLNLYTMLLRYQLNVNNSHLYATLCFFYFLLHTSLKFFLPIFRV